jgi:TolA-binding protein
VVGTVAATVVLVLVVLGVLVSSRTSRLASENLLSAAHDEAGLRAVITAYPRSDAAADAMLLLAASLRNSGKMEESDALYSRFSESFPRHPLAVSGALGRAASARVAGKTDLALSAYQQAAAAYPQSYGAPFALFSQARLLAQQGKGEEAKRVIQTLGSSYPNSISAQAAGVGGQLTR